MLSAQNNTCVLLLFPAFILASAFYPCLYKYIMCLGSHLRVHCTHALKGSYFCLRVNYLKKQNSGYAHEKGVLLLVDSVARKHQV